MRSGSMIDYQDYRKNGVSLIEVILAFALFSVLSLSMLQLISQVARNSKGTYIQSTRSLLLNRQMDEMSTNRGNFTSLFNDASMNTSLSDSGQVIPYMRKIDATNSNTFKRVSYFYLYNQTTDPVTSAWYKAPLTQTTDEFRIRIGNTSNLIDSSGKDWTGDSNAYDATNKVPGYVTGSSGTAGNNVVDIVNTSGNDDGLFQYYREGTGSTQINYNFDVPNGRYTVMLYFSELSASVTGSAPNRRLMDIYLEGILYNFNPYSPYEITGGSNRGNVQSYDVGVSDGVLNVSIRRNSNSNYDARISGIVVKKRQI
jgi:Tfp pilus assembly protein PilV